MGARQSHPLPTAPHRGLSAGSLREPPRRISLAASVRRWVGRARFGGALSEGPTGEMRRGAGAQRPRAQPRSATPRRFHGCRRARRTFTRLCAYMARFANTGPKPAAVLERSLRIQSTRSSKRRGERERTGGGESEGGHWGRGGFMRPRRGSVALCLRSPVPEGS